MDNNLNIGIAITFIIIVIVYLLSKRKTEAKIINSNDRYISEDLWYQEFEPIYNNEEEMEKRIQACSPLHKEMVEFAKTLADKPSNWYLHVWTAIDGDDGTMYLVNGPALCNRIDWYFTKNPYVQDKLITVAFEDQEDFEEDIKR